MERCDPTKLEKHYKLVAEVTLCHDAYNEIGLTAPNLYIYFILIFLSQYIYNKYFFFKINRRRKMLFSIDFLFK